MWFCDTQVLVVHRKVIIRTGDHVCVCSLGVVHLTTWQTEEAPRSLQMRSRTSLTKEGRETEQMLRRVERECAARVSAHIGMVRQARSARSNGATAVGPLSVGVQT